ncbi:MULTISPECIES: YggS family pyridoxal phosphate-dependent enzyme [Pontibacillus]|uniref:Pyridoxal phosphate homeostasis protein n=1 Tax=Pontibacillus chungwhensis TaxID=265426 RepID=A0ABY8V2M2_9BACI|nr:YggS family pyridoxal phosphate-dependent enzyme [Pontibacillus chungwhensis]MCD5322604.1 YggS family pyridoxal phosphate-dependent enzyme [Pontibacillus sp. HN14]WIF99888.1 YggS family pyridoxal phosphate-dependent enzyme [Pontibacillus chungwhensis]
MDIKKNVETVTEEIEKACKKSGRVSSEVTVIAVTKYVSTERAQEAVNAGIIHLGENRAEGLESKYESIGSRAKWHFIGSLQSRKVKQVVDTITSIHSLDRMSLAKEIHKRANRKISCFVQVNVSGEESKHGLSPEEVIPFIDKIKDYDNIVVEGLMTMAPHTEEEEVLRSTFRQLRQLKEKVEAKGFSHAPCHGLSMGMSNDYQIAIEEGATHVRIGSKLVGREDQ